MKNAILAGKKIASFRMRGDDDFYNGRGIRCSVFSVLQPPCPMRIACISDVHEQWSKIKMPEADVLIVAGDITYSGAIQALSGFCAWLEKQPYKKKIVIAGNHDGCFESSNGYLSRRMIPEAGGTYLQDSGTEYQGTKFWGSPLTPEFGNWSFGLPRGQLHKKWSLIPSDTNVLITHGPPMGILDRTEAGIHAGCRELLEELPRLTALKLHVFGHLHEGAGMKEIHNTTFVNASVCTRAYKPTNAVRVVEL